MRPWCSPSPTAKHPSRPWQSSFGQTPRRRRNDKSGFVVFPRPLLLQTKTPDRVNPPVFPRCFGGGRLRGFRCDMLNLRASKGANFGIAHRYRLSGLLVLQFLHPCCEPLKFIIKRFVMIDCTQLSNLRFEHVPVSYDHIAQPLPYDTVFNNTEMRQEAKVLKKINIVLLDASRDLSPLFVVSR
jgi:hypothetical protein